MNISSRIYHYLVVAGTGLIIFASLITGLADTDDQNKPLTGRELYISSCATCHGFDGRGTPSSIRGFDTPVPDFTDCSFASREANADWVTVALKGGPARGFSRIMPSFEDMHTFEELERIVTYIRAFCKDRSWPRGSLNLPRAQKTTKAFPEDELVITGDYGITDNNRILFEFIYEFRVGARGQLEFILPLGATKKPNDIYTLYSGGYWRSALGDAGIAGKYVLFHSLRAGSILSLGGEVFFPTGNNGLGTGTFLFEPYIAYGQALPLDFFLQFQGGAGIPVDNTKTPDSAFWRLALGKTFLAGRYGHAVTPMIELTGSTTIKAGAAPDWNWHPQIQVPLNVRQHVSINIGASLPVNDFAGREKRILFYILWDWFDGGFFEGW